MPNNRLSIWRWVMLAVLSGIICGEMALQTYFPEEGAQAHGCCQGWKPCPGRKAFRVNGRKHYWYCGPDNPDGGAP